MKISPKLTLNTFVVPLDTNVMPNHHPSKLSLLNINWVATSDTDLIKTTGLSRNTIYEYRRRHKLPPGPKRISEKYANGGRKRTDIDYEYAFRFDRGRKRGTPVWRKAVTRYYGSACTVCGYLKDKVKNHCHHRVELFNGGKNTVRNGIVLCSRCHDEVHAGLISFDQVDKAGISQ